MKFKLSILLLVPILAFAQKKGTTELYFNQKYFQCEDNWVVFPKSDTDTTYVYGYIYLDEEAGFTFNLEGKFKITEAGEYVVPPSDSSVMIKYRLDPKTKLVAILPSNKLEELNLPTEPAWLKLYKDSSDTIKTLVRRGFHYNHAGASSVALNYLEAAYEVDAHTDGLEFELAYAYNATKQYEKAVSVLEGALEYNSENYFFYRELGYALIQLNEVAKAEQAYLKGIKLSDNNFQKSEMAVNMAQAYYKLKDQDKFKKWANLTKKYAAEGSQYLGYIKQFEKSLENLQ